VKPAPFAYHRAANLEDAVDALAASGGKVLAGGQSLVPIMSMRLAAPAALVDLNHVAGLDTIEIGSGGVRIGALVRHAALEHDEAAYVANPLLRRTVVHVAHATIRNRGTTVGSLVHADPAAEMPAVLALLGGHVDVVSRDRGARRIAAADFAVGPMESSLQADEVAVSAFFPDPAAGSGTSWVELARRHGDYAMVGVGAVVSVQDRCVVQASVALISVGPTPIVIDLTETLAGTPYQTAGTDAGGDPHRWQAAQDLVSASIDPEGDIHATAAYRGHLACVLTARALTAAADDSARGSAG
jgi:aerobic carbon-monoxide dehydrogenase medium subunit